MISDSQWRGIFLLLALFSVDGTYLPNYGYVGCYLERMTSLQNINHTRKVIQFSRHRCIQECLKDSYSYAAFTKGNICNCISDYNQTFAVDEKNCDKNCVHESQYQCGSTDKMTVFNTMYDMKPLLAIPGNDSLYVTLWNTPMTGRFHQTFNGSVFRNPDIDRWKRKQKYYKPEFVSLVAFNQFGQDIWSVDFNTNDTIDGSLHGWMKPENILSVGYKDRQVKISIRNDTVKVFQDQLIYFAHGAFLPEGKRVTIVTTNKIPQKVYEWLPANCSNTTTWTDVEPPLDVTNSKPFSFCKADNSSDYVLVENTNVSCEHTSDLKCVKFDSYIGRATFINTDTFKNTDKNQRKIKLKQQRISGSNDCEETFLRSFCLHTECSNMTYSLNVTEDKMTLPIFNGRWLKSNVMYELDSFIKVDSISIKTQWNCSFYFNYSKLSDNQMMFVDKLAVFGFYHNEEPKRSKWEFLNDLPMEEIINIMRPHISKSKAEGTVPKRNISANVRKKESASDRRTSSKGLGALGGTILCFVFLLFFIADIPTLKQQLSACVSRLLR